MSESSAAEQVYETVKQQVLRGELPPGSLLSEAIVGQESGVSRTPVHVAFLRLESEGLLELHARRGALVPALSPREARDVIEMREAIESMAVQAMVLSARLPDELVAELDRSVDAQRAAVEAGDIAGYVELDDAFHRAVVDAAGNAIASGWFAQLHDRQHRIRHELLAPDASLAASLVDEHAALAAAVAEADWQGYRAMLRTHVERLQPAR